MARQRDDDDDDLQRFVEADAGHPKQIGRVLRACAGEWLHVFGDGVEWVGDERRGTSGLREIDA